MKRFSVLIAVGIALALTTSARAAEKQPAGASSRANAPHLQNQGHDEETLTAYVRAVLRGTGLSDSTRHIRAILEHTTTLNSDTRQLWARFLELADFTGFLEDRIQQVTRANAQLADFIRASVKSEADRTQFDRLLTAPVSIAQEGVPPDVVVEGPAESPSGLQQAVAWLSAKKSRQIKALEREQARQRRLWAVRTRLIGEAIRRYVRSPSAAQLPAQAAGPDKAFEQRLASLQRQMNEMKAKTSELTKKLADLALQIYEKDSQLAQKNGQMDHLESQLTDAHQRLMLVQRLLQDKDRTIDALKSSAVRGSAGVGAMVTSTDMRGLRADFLDLQKAAEGNAKTAALLRNLDQRVGDLNRKFLVMDKRLSDRDGQISRLQKELDGQKAQLASWKARNAGKEGEVVRLTGIVEIYKAKLASTRRRLEQAQLELYMKSRNRGISASAEAGIPSDTVAHEAIDLHLDGPGAVSNQEIYRRIKARVRNILPD